MEAILHRRRNQLKKVWTMLKKMSGKRSSVHVDGEQLAITNEEKANLLGTIFVSVHSGNDHNF